MLSQHEIMQTIQMIDQQHLDVRTITMGISLLSCARSDPKQACGAIYDKITRYAEKLVSTGEAIEKEFGIPIVNKRISVTPIALVAAAAETDNYAPFAAALDRAAKTTGVNFIGGFSALVQKGMTEADRKLIASIPEALSTTDLVCASVNVGSTKAGIDMDAVALMGRTIKDLAGRTADQGGFGCAKLVVFCNAVEDNPFMAGAFHGVGEPEKVINVGVSGPGVVYHALQGVKGQPFDVVAETIKKTAFRITRMGQLVAQEASRRLDTPFGIVDLSLAPTPAIGDSVARILEEMGLEVCGTHGTTAALAPAQRRGEEGRRHGLLPRGRPVRRLHPGERGRGHDRRRQLRGPHSGQAGGHDLCVLGGPGHDRRPRGYPGGDPVRHHRRRGGHRHGQLQDHCRAHHPRPRQAGGGYGGVRRSAGLRPGAAGPPLLRQSLRGPGRPDPRPHAELEKLTHRGLSPEQKKTRPPLPVGRADGL